MPYKVVGRGEDDGFPFHQRDPAARRTAPRAGAQQDAESWEPEKFPAIPFEEEQDASFPPLTGDHPAPHDQVVPPRKRKKKAPGGQYRGPRDFVPGGPTIGGPQIVGRNGKGQICCPPVWNVCVIEECEDRFLKKLEEMLVTSRGPTFRGPPKCVQPSQSTDLESPERVQALPVGVGSGVVIARVCARGNDNAVVKGIAWIAGTTSTAFKTDPYLELEINVRVVPAGGGVGSGRLVQPYVGIRRQLAVSLQAMTSATIDCGPDEDIIIEAVRFAGTSANIVIEGRAKGWAFEPPVRTERVSGQLSF